MQRRNADEMRRPSHPWIVLLAIVLVAAVAAPVSALTRGTAPSGTPTAAAIIAQVEHDTERVRGLHARHAVPVTMLDPTAFKRLVAKDFDRDTTAADVRDEQQPLVLLGILPPSLNLRNTLRQAEADNVAAFYDPKPKRFFIPVTKQGLSLNDQVTISHEYTHALQDQTFDLNRVRPDTSRQSIHNSDRDLARTALIEGDATVEMQLYAQTVFTQQQYTQFQREAQQAAAGATDNTPQFLLDQLLFPYTQGSLFEESLLEQSPFGVSFAPVNRAFRQPPNSTREIMHPALYQHDPGAPAPDLAPPKPALPAGWRRVDSDVIGEYELQDTLAQHIDATTAARAADNWRADRYSLFDRGDDFLMAWRLHTDSAASARTLSTALTTYFQRRYHAALATKGGVTTHTESGSALALRLSGADVELVLASRGALQSVVTRALRAMG